MHVVSGRRPGDFNNTGNVRSVRIIKNIDKNMSVIAHAGMLVLVTKLYDVVSDPVMGLIADRTNTRWGKYRPYLLWIAIPFADS